MVAFRRHTLLPLDHRLYALQPTAPQINATEGDVEKLDAKVGQLLVERSFVAKASGR